MEIEEIRPRLWRWTATHPDWSPEEGGPEGWEPEVGPGYGATTDVDCVTGAAPCLDAPSPAGFSIDEAEITF